MKLNFNPQLSTWMHLDLNSCFATIEQQANPLLRGKPIAVAAYTTPRGCILAPSIEAKRFGVKVGMRVIDGKKICPNLIILSPDPNKYRFVNQILFNLLNTYSPNLTIKSIDEILINFKDTPISKIKSILEIGQDIKNDIKTKIGEYLTISVGISTNPYLAKLAAGLHKPDGLDEINHQNITKVLQKLTLIDLPYIKYANAWRLCSVGIKNPVDFYHANLQQLKSAFASINGYYWHLRLHGYEVDDVASSRKTIGHSYALPYPTNDPKELTKILCKLVEKTGRKLRHNQLTTSGIHLALGFNDGSFWHHGQKITHPIYISLDIFKAFYKLLFSIKNLKPVTLIFITCFNIKKDLYSQLNFFENETKKQKLTKALDQINDKWGEFAIYSANMINMQDKIVDRIAFGKTWDNNESPIINEVSNWERIAYE